MRAENVKQEIEGNICQKSDIMGFQPKSAPEKSFLYIFF